MIKNYFKTAIRNFKRNFTFSIINVLGLTLGLAVSALILLYVVNELTYDAYHKDADRIYRISQSTDVDGRSGVFGNYRVNVPLGPYLVENYPNVETQTRVSREKQVKLSYREKSFNEKVFYADSSFFQIFSLDFILGNPRTALTAPFSMVLTEKIAEKFFGDRNPVGEIIEGENNQLYTVTGVIQNVPENSHFKFDMLGSFATLYQLNEKSDMEGWGLKYHSHSAYTYIKLANGYAADKMTSCFQEISKTYLSGNPRYTHHFTLESLKKIHLHYYSDEPGSISRVWLLGLIGLFVLLIACVNFMNLGTVQAQKRMKEIGVKKVFGVYKKQLIGQFLFESILMGFISMVLAITLAEILLPSFNGFILRNLSFDYIGRWPFTIGLVALTLFVGILAGSYPAFYMSSFKPIVALPGKFTAKSKKALGRNILVIFQFAISIFLLCCTGVVLMQFYYMNNTDLGFDKEHIVAIPTDFEDEQLKLSIFRNELSKISGISHVSINSGLPFCEIIHERIQLKKGEKEERSIVYLTDSHYADLLGIDIVKGRKFSDNISREENNIIINETFARKLEVVNPIGQRFTIFGKEREVIGIVNDYHFDSFHRSIFPMLYLYSEKPLFFSQIAVKIAATDIQQTLQKIEQVYKTIDPSFDFKYSFLDQTIKAEYEKEQRTVTIFSCFTLLAIFIASMGLYGLALFIGSQRTKEIGVRKILGSSIREIVKTLSKDFIILILISAALAIPAAWYYMNIWLQSFAYKVGHRWVIFVLATLLAAVLAFVTILFQSLKAAKTNPVDIIRYE